MIIELASHNFWWGLGIGGMLGASFGYLIAAFFLGSHEL